MHGLAIAFDVPDSEDFPEKAAFEFARDNGLRVTTHAGVWGATTDVGIGHMFDAGVMTDQITYVHSASLGPESYQKIAATGGTVSVATESEQKREARATRRRGRSASTASRRPSRWTPACGGAPTYFSAMRATLSSDRSRDHLEAHVKGDTVAVNRLRAEDVLRMATMGGAKSLGMEDKIGSITPGKKADLLLIKNDQSPATTPILNPTVHVVPGEHRRRAHRRRERQGAQVPRASASASTSSRRGMPWRTRSSTCAANSASRPGKRACIHRSIPTRRSRTPTSTRRIDRP